MNELYQKALLTNIYKVNQYITISLSVPIAGNPFRRSLK